MIVKSAKHVTKTIALNLRYQINSSLLYDKLTQMFRNQQFIMDISQKVRILPDYFTYQYIKEFNKSSDISKYNRYVAKQKYGLHDKNNKNSPAAQIFQKFPKFKKSIPVLDCYLDWLSKNKLQKNTNEYYKNKCTMEMFDMRNPQNWFAGNKDRHFIYHHGPTNSGKTSSAIKELKQLPKDRKGVYMAPLRLLAWEMQQKLQNCNLITGQDKEFRVSNLTSCTIEALNTNEDYDTAIIDEIQMIGDQQRGWSWTKAILSTKAKRVHLCGDQRAIGLISKLVKQCGGTLQERRYSRLGKLKLIQKIFDIKNIQEGDCMIQFSVQTLHQIRRKIKNELERRKNQQKVQQIKDQNYSLQNQENKSSQIAMVYGRLPPQCRKQQAHKFNANIAPYLVATNAIGMGLNLNIKRIIFAGIKRRNSKGYDVQLEEHQIQQIAGRAGRGSNDGLVQCVSQDILRKVRKALRNVNKTYGINLEDEQSSDQIKNSTDQVKNFRRNEDEQNYPKKSKSNQENWKYYDQQLKRALTDKQRKIQKAGLFIEYNFLKRMMVFLEQYYCRKISLAESLKMFLNLALKTEELYFLSEKPQLLQWIKKLQKNHTLQTRDTFEIAKCLSMHYNSPFVKQNMAYFASQFEQKKIIDIPKSNIQNRNQEKVGNNFQKMNILQSNYSVVQVYINLWTKYEFIFWDIHQAKRIKEETSKLIKQVLEDEDGFIFGKQKKVTVEEAADEQNEQNEDAVNRKLTILDEETSDIEQIRM